MKKLIWNFTDKTDNSIKLSDIGSAYNSGHSIYNDNIDIIKTILKKKFNVQLI